MDRKKEGVRKAGEERTKKKVLRNRRKAGGEKIGRKDGGEGRMGEAQKGSMKNKEGLKNPSLEKEKEGKKR